MPRLKQSVFEKQDARKKARTEAHAERDYRDLLPIEIRQMTCLYLTMSILDDIHKDIPIRRRRISEEQESLDRERTFIVDFHLRKVDKESEELREHYGEDQGHTVWRMHDKYRAWIKDYAEELKVKRTELEILDALERQRQVRLFHSFGFYTVQGYADRALKLKVI